MWSEGGEGNRGHWGQEVYTGEKMCVKTLTETEPITTLYQMVI